MQKHEPIKEILCNDMAFKYFYSDEITVGDFLESFFGLKEGSLKGKITVKDEQYLKSTNYNVPISMDI